MQTYPEIACAKISTSKGCAKRDDALLNIAYVQDRGRPLFGGIREWRCSRLYSKDP
jgi:hypothetical protein